MLNRLEREYDSKPIEGEEAGDRAYSDPRQVKLVELGGEPSADLTFIGRGEREDFQVKQIRLCEARDEEYGLGRDGADWVTARDEEGERCYYANVGGGLERIRFNLWQSIYHERQLRRADAKSLEPAARIFQEAEERLGAADLKTLISAIDQERPEINGRFKFIDGTVQPDGRLKEYSYSILPADDENRFGEKILKIEVRLRRESGGDIDEDWTYVGQLDGPPISLVHRVRVKIEKNGAPDDEDRRRFGALLTGFMRRFQREQMDEMLRSGR